MDTPHRHSVTAAPTGHGASVALCRTVAADGLVSRAVRLPGLGRRGRPEHDSRA